MLIYDDKELNVELLIDYVNLKRAPKFKACTLCCYYWPTNECAGYYECRGLEGGIGYVSYITLVNI